MAMRGSFLGVMALTLAGQIAAVAFEVTVAARFGTGPDADALAVALPIVLTPSLELAGWVSTVFLPFYVAAHERGAGATAFFRRAAVALIALTALVATAMVAGAPGLTALVAPDAVASTSALVRGFAPLIVLIPMIALWTGVLQAHRRFQLPALRQVFWYGGGLVAVALAARRVGPLAVPAGMVGGLLIFFAALALRTRTAPVTPDADRDAGALLARAGVLVMPLAVVSLLNYVNISFERSLAARLPDGSVAALTYASRLMSFPLNLFVVNATTMLLPALATYASRRDARALDETVAHATKLVIVLMTPIAVLAMALAEPAVRVLLERGAFSSESTARTAVAVAWYAPGMVAMAAVQVLYRTYQAVHAVWRLAAVSAVGIASSIVLMPTLVALLGYRGLPLAATLTMAILLAAMVAGLRARLPGLVHSVVTALPRAGLAGLAAGAAALAVRSVLTGDAARLAAGGVAGVVCYAAILSVVAPAEARAALALLAPRGDAAP